MNPALVSLIAEHVPDAIQLVKLLWKKSHPGEPEPSGDDVVKAYQQALEDSLSIDNQWLAAHPKPSGD